MNAAKTGKTTTAARSSQSQADMGRDGTDQKRACSDEEGRSRVI